MPLKISRNDITTINAKAIVVPTDSSFSGSGSIDFIVQSQASNQLQKLLKQHADLKTSQVYLTDSCGLKNCEYLIFVSGPIYQGVLQNDLLRESYWNCLEVAEKNNIDSIAIPLISTGNFGYPKGEGLKVAFEAISEFLLNDSLDMMIELLVYDKEAFDLSNSLFADVHDYLTENYVQQLSPDYSMGSSPSIKNNKEFFSSLPKQNTLFNKKRKRENNCNSIGWIPFAKEETLESTASVYSDGAYEYEDRKFIPDISFGEYLIELIDERGLSDPEVYKRANMDRKLFNHIKNDANYHPKKETALSLAISLRLNLQQTNDLLEKAGFVLSRSSKFDLIISYCIEREIFDIFTINQLLFKEDQKLLC